MRCEAWAWDVRYGTSAQAPSSPTIFPAGLVPAVLGLAATERVARPQKSPVDLALAVAMLAVYEFCLSLLASHLRQLTAESTEIVFPAILTQRQGAGCEVLKTEPCPRGGAALCLGLICAGRFGVF